MNADPALCDLADNRSGNVTRPGGRAPALGRPGVACELAHHVGEAIERTVQGAYDPSRRMGRQRMSVPALWMSISESAAPGVSVDEKPLGSAIAVA